MSSKHQQQGFAGILLSAVLSSALALATLEYTQTANSTAYDIQNRANVEEAAHLAEAAYGELQRVLADENRFNQWLEPLSKNAQVVLGGCTPGHDAPTTLQPTTPIVLRLAVPYGGRQSLGARAVIAPKDCTQAVSYNNYRAVIDITGASNCQVSSTAQRQETCVMRSITLNRDRGAIFKTQW